MNKVATVGYKGFGTVLCLDCAMGLKREMAPINSDSDQTYVCDNCGDIIIEIFECPNSKFCDIKDCHHRFPHERSAGCEHACFNGPCQRR